MLSHTEISEFNFDDNLEVLWDVIESKETCLATALLLYWRLEGPFIATRKDSVAFKMNQLLRERILADYYNKSELHYDPASENSLSKTQIYKLKKQGVSNVLLAGC